MNCSEKPSVAVAMLGARMHYAVPRLLHEAGMLERFYTDSYIGNKPWLERALKAIPAAWRPDPVRRWLGRTDSVLPPEKVTSFEGLGLWYALARRRVRSEAEQERLYAEVALRFSQNIGANGLGGADILWAFNTAAHPLFRAARDRGMYCILEQTILPGRLSRRLLAEEATRWPGWARHSSAVTGGEAAETVLEGCEAEEWRLADRVVAGSDFVRSGLVELGVPEAKISVIPYGVDSSRFRPLPHQREGGRERPLRVLFAGEVGLRKGVPDLLHAFDRLVPDAIELRLAGAMALAEDKVKPWHGRVTFLGAVPRERMHELYRWADVFVLPSIVEGSATVVYEALMSGVPVITTPNAGSIVSDGENGFIVPTRDPRALAAAIAAYHADRSLLARHREGTAKSRSDGGLERYGAELESLVDRVAAQQG